MVAMLQTPSHRPVRIMDPGREVDPCHEARGVPDNVRRAIADVRLMGWDDMLDRENVLFLAGSLGHRRAAAWLAANRHLYFIAMRQALAA